MNIKVFLYSYKNKNLLNICNDILSKSYNKVEIKVYDQSNVNRIKFFSENENITYKHIKWDDNKGKNFFVQEVINEDFDYLLVISDNVILTQDWDLKSLNELKENSIVSGSNYPIVKLNNFDLKIKYKKIKTPSEVYFLDKDFIFIKKDNINILKKIFLKDKGTDILLSLRAINSGLKIISMSSEFYTKSNIYDGYFPYSLRHGYNKLIYLIKSNNVDTDIFNKKNNIDIKNINFVPFEVNDVGYSDIDIKLDSSEATRFHSGIFKISL